MRVRAQGACHFYGCHPVSCSAPGHGLPAEKWTPQLNKIPKTNLWMRAKAFRSNDEFLPCQRCLINKCLFFLTQCQASASKDDVGRPRRPRHRCQLISGGWIYSMDKGKWALPSAQTQHTPVYDVLVLIEYARLWFIELECDADKECPARLILVHSVRIATWARLTVRLRNCPRILSLLLDELSHGSLHAAHEYGMQH